MFCVWTKGRRRASRITSLPKPVADLVMVVVVWDPGWCVLRPTTAPQCATNFIPLQEEFRVFWNGVQLRTRKISTYKSLFQILSNFEDSAKTKGARLVGDCIVRGPLTEFCSRAPRTIICGGVDGVLPIVDEEARLAANNKMYNCEQMTTGHEFHHLLVVRCTSFLARVSAWNITHWLRMLPFRNLPVSLYVLTQAEADLLFSINYA